MTNLEEARAYFAQDRFATENGAVIREIGEGYAVCSLELTERHRNALGNVMGGAVFMLGDFAFAVASNYGKRPTVSTTTQGADLVSDIFLRLPAQWSDAQSVHLSSSRQDSVESPEQ